MFLDPAWLALLSERSERNFTSSIASAAGVDRERKAYLGRWHVVEASDEYVRTAWQVVTSLQKLIVQTLCESSAELAILPLRPWMIGFKAKGGLKRPGIFWPAFGPYRQSGPPGADRGSMWDKEWGRMCRPLLM